MVDIREWKLTAELARVKFINLLFLNQTSKHRVRWTFFYHG